MPKKQKFKLITRRQLQLGKYASRDKTRTGMRAIEFNGEVATVVDGHKLIQCKNLKPHHPNDFPKSDIRTKLKEPFSLKMEDAETCLGFLPKKCNAPIIKNCVAVGCDAGTKIKVSADIPAKGTGFSKVEIPFPCHKKLFEEQSGREKASVMISAKYLKEVCEYILNGKGRFENDGIILEICKNGSQENPITMTCRQDDYEIKALIMPMRY